MKYAIFILTLVFTLAAQAKPITAKSFLVTDNKGQVILEKNADRTQPIASITKLMAGNNKAGVLIDNSIPKITKVFQPSLR
jgi:D-alanyl-D-alanine carboxypeptidase